MLVWPAGCETKPGLGVIVLFDCGLAVRMSAGVPVTMRDVCGVCVCVCLLWAWAALTSGSGSRCVEVLLSDLPSGMDSKVKA